MNLDLAWNIGFEDGTMNNVALPFDGWDTNAETFAYLRGYYVGKQYRKILG